MKKTLLVTLLFVLLLSTIFLSCKKERAKTADDYLIRTEIPIRPSGQKDVLQLKAEPIEKVRVAFIGLGHRGAGKDNSPYFGAIGRFLHIPNVEIAALCDIKKENVDRTNKRLASLGHAEVQGFYGDSTVWREVTKLENIDLVYIATDWVNHAHIAAQAMKDGKHVAIEVPAAMTMDEIWDLVNTSEQTRKHCMQLENCIYDYFELTTLNMVQQGLLGEIVHGEGAYIHNLSGGHPIPWRWEYNKKHRGDVYPTHGLGHVCLAMNIHRGDKMNYLVSVDSDQISAIEYAKKKGETVTDFKNGEHTSTLIRTENGKSILIEHNISSPRPYDRMFQLTGTKGFATKYPAAHYALGADSMDNDVDFEKLNPHRFLSPEQMEKVSEKYKHPIHVELEEKAKIVGGHGGMDFIMDYRLIYCLHHGLPLDMDVYDLAEWCSLGPLTALSLEYNSAPVEIPDFTRGAWDKLNKAEFHFIKE